MISPKPDTVRQLFALPRFPSGDARRRLRFLIEPLRAEAWWQSLDAIKITGSNGKGSVAAMTAAILDAAGVSSGLYTSPHVRTPRERVAVGGEWISQRSFEQAAAWALERVVALERARPGERVGVFEALTALALFAFAEAGTGAVVLEAGIGGRLDPTGIVPGRLTSLVSVDLEHTALLGTTIKAIARDKADLADDGSSLFLGVLPAELAETVAEHVAPRSVTVVHPDSASGGQLPDILGLAGGHQRHNARLATRLATSWLTEHRPDLSEEERAVAVRVGLRDVRLPGRFERVRREPDVYADVAHTPAATAALADTVREHLVDRHIVLLTGVAAGRDPATLLAPLAPLALWAIATEADHRGSDAGAVAASLLGLREDLEVVVEPRLDRGVAIALEVAARKGLTVLVAGGFFLTAEAIAILEGRDPRRLGLF